VGEIRNSYKISVRKPEGERPFMRPIDTDANVIIILRCSCSEFIWLRLAMSCRLLWTWHGKFWVQKWMGIFRLAERLLASGKTTLLLTPRCYKKAKDECKNKIVCGSGDLAPHILNLDSGWRWVVIISPWSLHPMDRTPSNHRIGGWVGLRVRMDVVKTNISAPPGTLSRACSLVISGWLTSAA
jgi:hypothetical protein